MQVKTLGYLMTTLTLLTVGAAAQATPQAALKSATVTAMAPQVVVVKIGAAMQEEYIGGEPSERITTYPTGETAQKSVTLKNALKPQS